MANLTFGKPEITGSVLRSDTRSRPIAREPSLYPARGFPSARSSSSPIGPRPVHPSPVQCYRTRSTRYAGPQPATLPPLPRSIRTDNCPAPVRRRKRRLITEAAFIARARLNTGLTP
jgi:hypothetical protein